MVVAGVISSACSSLSSEMVASPDRSPSAAIDPSEPRDLTSSEDEAFVVFYGRAGGTSRSSVRWNVSDVLKLSVSPSEQSLSACTWKRPLACSARFFLSAH